MLCFAKQLPSPHYSTLFMDDPLLQIITVHRWPGSIMSYLHFKDVRRCRNARLLDFFFDLVESIDSLMSEGSAVTSVANKNIG